MKRKMTSSRARRRWLKSVKSGLLTKDHFTNLHDVQDLRKLEYVLNYLLNIPLESQCLLSNCFLQPI